MKTVASLSLIFTILYCGISIPILSSYDETVDNELSFNQVINALTVLLFIIVLVYLVGAMFILYI